MTCLLCVPVLRASTLLQLGTVNVKRVKIKSKTYHDLLPGSPPLSNNVTLSSNCFPAFRPAGPTRLPNPLYHKNQYYSYIHTYIHIYEYISYLHRCPVLWPVPGFQIFNQAFQTLVGGIAYVALSFFAKVCHQHTLFKRLQYLFTGNVT